MAVPRRSPPHRRAGCSTRGSSPPTAKGRGASGADVPIAHCPPPKLFIFPPPSPPFFPSAPAATLCFADIGEMNRAEIGIDAPEAGDALELRLAHRYLAVLHPQIVDDEFALLLGFARF